jgi:hypothetical protein
MGFPLRFYYVFKPEIVLLPCELTFRFQIVVLLHCHMWMHTKLEALILMSSLLPHLVKTPK